MVMVFEATDAVGVLVTVTVPGNSLVGVLVNSLVGVMVGVSVGTLVGGAFCEVILTAVSVVRFETVRTN